MLDRYQAVVFDLDGVIIDSESLHEEAKRIIFDRHGLDVPDAFYDDVKGRTDRDVIEQAVTVYGTDSLDVDALIEAKQEVFSARFETMETVPGALDFIRRLHAGGVRIGLVTSATEADQLRAFEQFGLADYFEAVVNAGHVTRPKPDPEPYRLIVEQLHVPANRCLVVEDAVNGVRSAHAAGCDVAGLATSFRTDVLLEAGADYAASDYADLTRQLGV